MAPGLVDGGDILVFEQGQYLPLALETSDHLRSVHPELDHFERDSPLNSPALLGLPNSAHPSRADLAYQGEVSNDGAWFFGRSGPAFTCRGLVRHGGLGIVAPHLFETF